MSTIEVNKITPVSGGTTVQVGESGDTINIPSGATLANAGTMTGVPAPTSGVSASAIDSGTMAAARLGSGTASSSTFLRGDQTYAEPGGGEYIKIANNSGTNSVGAAYINDCFSTTYRTYVVTFQFENDRNGNQIWLRFLKDNDSEISVAKYRYASQQVNNGGTESTITANDSSYWRMTGGTAGGNTAIFGGCFGFMYVHNPYTIASGQAGAGNLYRCGWNAHYCEYDDSGGVSNLVTTGMLEQNSDNVAGLQFMPSANYIAKRNITVWGLKEY